jgi:phenylalanyl-tRNA synthetase beta chain
MTTVTFERKNLEKHIKLTKEVIEKISLFGTPLEKINEREIEVEIFPNRPDLISMHGFLRGFKAFLGKEKGLKEYKLNKPKENYNVKIEQSVKDVRPYTACAIVSNLKLDDDKIKEIIDLQEKLHLTIGRNRKKVAIGIYPLEKIKLPITYRASPPKDIKFIPLNETRELNGNQILTKHPTGRAYGYLLDEHSKFPVFVDANNKVLSMPPIINSIETGKISNETKEVFVECSGHNISVLEKTLNIIVTTLADMWGQIHQMSLDYGNKKLTTPNLSTEKMKLSLENTNKLLGLKLKESDLKKLLPKMGYGYQNRTVEIPAWRTDILHEVDLIEDVAIAYGYENLSPEIPNVATIAEETQETKLKTKLSELLVGLGLIELSTYHLIKQNEAKLMRLQEKIEVDNSKTEYKYLRPNLLTSSLRILSENKDHDYPQETFEIGTAFSHDRSKETGIKESTNLVITLAPSNFTKTKQILEYIASSLVTKFTLEESVHPQLIEGRTANVKFERKVIGYLGEIHPETLRAWTIKMPASVIEIELDSIFERLKD